MLSPWRKRLIVAALILLALVGSFSAGRFSAPLKVEEKIVTVKGETVIEKVFVKGDTVYLKGETKIVFRDKTTKPDGTIVEHEIEKTETKEDKKVSIVSNSERAATLTEHTESTKTVTLRPSWRIAVLVGAQYPAPLAPIAGPLVLGAMGEYRIVGGLWVGVWITTGLAAGAVVSFEF